VATRASKHVDMPMKLIFVCALVLASWTAASAQKQISTAVSIRKSAWIVDGRSFGFVDDALLAKMPRVSTFPAVQFISDSNVAITFVTREAVSGLQRRDDPNRQLPFKLHEIVLDADTGREKARREWQNDDANIGLFARADGTYIVFSRNYLRLYSADDQLLKQESMTPNENASADLVGVDPSPSRNSFLVRYRVSKALECDWITVPAMTVSRAPCEIAYRTAISDQGMAIAAPVKERPRDLQVQIQELKEPWKILCDTREVPACGAPWFVDNRLLLVHTNREVDLLSVDGVVAMRKGIVSGHGEVLNPNESVSSSPGSHRVAISVSKTERTYDGMFIDSNDVFFEVQVYDIPSDTWVFQLQNDTRPIPGGNGRYTRPFTDLDGLALSPNGRQLVIEVDGKVLAFTLPQ